MYEKVIVGRVYHLFDHKNEDKAIERFIEEIEKYDIFKGDNLESILYALNNENHLIKYIINWCHENQFKLIAQIILAHCYEKGIGVERNNQKALEYYQKSSDMGYQKGIGI